MRIAFLSFTLAFGLLLWAQDDKATTDQPHNVGNGVSPPVVIYKTDPSYTEEANSAKLQGSVTLRVVVGSDGKTHQISVTKSLGMGLDEKAVEAVQKWRFRPGMLNGEPVSVVAVIEVTFKLL